MEGLGFTLLLGMAPAPSDLVDAVDQIEVECSLEEASAFRVRFAIDQTDIGDWSILETDPFCRSCRSRSACNAASCRPRR